MKTKLKKLIIRLKKQAKYIGNKDYHYAVVDIRELEELLKEEGLDALNRRKK